MTANLRKFRRDVWYQIDGDMDPGKHGGTIGRDDGYSIEVRQIQPVIEYVGEREALDVGFPFWTREGSYDRADLAAFLADGFACRSFGIDPADFDLDRRADRLAVAAMAVQHGYCVDEGPCGWSRDVCPRSVVWWHGRGGRIVGGLAEEDTEYRRTCDDRADYAQPRNAAGRFIRDDDPPAWRDHL